MKKMYLCVFIVVFFVAGKSQTIAIEVNLPEPCNNATLAVENPENSNKLIVYPNPSDGKFIAEGYIEGNNKYSFILLHDISGKLVLRKKIKTDDQFIREELNLSYLNEGMYILTIENGSKGISRKIIIKK